MIRHLTRQQRILAKVAVAARIDVLAAKLTPDLKAKSVIEYEEVLRLRDEYRKLHVKLTESIK